MDYFLLYKTWICFIIVTLIKIVYWITGEATWLAEEDQYCSQLKETKMPELDSELD